MANKVINSSVAGRTSIFGINGSAISGQPVVKGARIVLAPTVRENKNVRLGVSTEGTSLSNSVTTFAITDVLQKAKNTGIVDITLVSGATSKGVYITGTIGNKIAIQYDVDMRPFVKKNDLLVTNRGVVVRVDSIIDDTDIVLSNRHTPSSQNELFDGGGSEYLWYPTNRKFIQRSNSRQIVRGASHRINLAMTYRGISTYIAGAAAIPKVLEFGSPSKPNKAVASLPRIRRSHVITDMRMFIQDGSVNTTTFKYLRNSSSDTFNITDSSIRSKRTTFALGGKPSTISKVV
jgi:hypothetical protein